MSKRDQEKLERQEALKADPDYIRLKELLQRQSQERVESFLAELSECEERDVNRGIKAEIETY